MRHLLLLCLSLLSTLVTAQDEAFPATWEGEWRGDLVVYQHGNEVQRIPMSLTILPLGSNGHYTWAIQYGRDESNLRPYRLIPADPEKGQFAIDEQNGIVLDGFFQRDTYFSLFSVSGSLLQTRVQRTQDTLLYEITAGPMEPLNTSGGRDSIPAVDSYAIPTLQRAILQRQK
jgi:hypothetical protein